jgi:heme-degrading monooxygenase HmoA
MIASVQLADLRVSKTIGAMRRPPLPGKVAGLRWAMLALAAPLRKHVLPAPTLRRAALVGFWDDDASLDAFVASEPAAATFARGWFARLEPLRAFGTWPGLDTDLPKSRRVEYDGPAVVLTLGRLRLTQAIRFLKTSAKAEEAVLRAPGLVWATGLGKPPFVATCSVWESTDAIAAYAFADADGAHPGAIAADRAKPFHHQQAFVRFRPVEARGALTGKNPLPERVAD